MTVESICFISHDVYGYFSPNQGFTGGGAERQLYLLSRRLTDEFDVSFVVGDFGQPPVEESHKISLYRGGEQLGSTGGIDQLVQIGRLFRALRRANPDVYVFRGGPKHAGLVYLLTEILQTPWIYIIANDENIGSRYDRQNPGIRRLFRHGLRRAQRVVAQTNYQQRQLGRRSGIDSVVIPNGYPPSSNVPPHSQRRHFLWVGRLSEGQKRPHLFLDLAERLPNESFILIGPHADAKEYRTALEDRIDLIDNVRFPGSVSPEKIHSYYRGAKALVNTSAFEGFPNTFLEAWRVGTPVVSIEVDPNRYLPLDDYTVFTDGSIDRLVGVISTLAADIELRSSIGTRSRGEFEERYAISQIVKRYAEEFQFKSHS